MMENDPLVHPSQRWHNAIKFGVNQVLMAIKLGKVYGRGTFH